MAQFRTRCSGRGLEKEERSRGPWYTPGAGQGFRGIEGWKKKKVQLSRKRSEGEPKMGVPTPSLNKEKKRGIEGMVAYSSRREDLFEGVTTKAVKKNHTKWSRLQAEDSFPTEKKITEPDGRGMEKTSIGGDWGEGMLVRRLDAKFKEAIGKQSTPPPPPNTQKGEG